MLRTWIDRFAKWNDYFVTKPIPVLVAASLLVLLQIGPWWYSTPDSTSYMSIARTLWSPDGPTNLGGKHLYFSLGYPLLISPLFRFSERPFLAIGIVHWLLTAAMLVGAYRWARPWGPSAALAASALTAMHVLYGISVRRPLSETAFAAAMVWTVLALDLVRTADTSRRRTVWAAIGCGALCIACLIRPHGVMIIPGFGAALLASVWGDRSRMMRQGALAAGVGFVAAAVFFTARAIDDRRAPGDVPHTYWNQLLYEPTTDQSLAERIDDGFFIQLFDWQRCIVPGAFKARSNTGHVWNANLPVASILAYFVVVGWLYMARSRGDVWTWTFPFYMALNIAWGADVGTRYTLPIMPVVLVAFWLGLTRTFAGTAWLFTTWLLLHAGTGLGMWLAVDLPKNVALNRHWGTVEKLCAQVDRDDVGAWQLTPEEVQYFRFVLDREVPPVREDDGAAKPFRPRWVFAPEEPDELPDGYERTEGGRSFYTLYRRVDAR